MEAKEAKRLSNLFKNYSTAVDKTKHYKALIKSYKDQIKAIYESLQLDTTLSKLEEARLIVESVELEYKVASKESVLKTYVDRIKEYKPEFDSRVKDCEENFDDVLARANELKQHNGQLSHALEQYDNPDNDLRFKTEFYLFLKHHIDAIEKSRGSLKVVK